MADALEALAAQADTLTPAAPPDGTPPPPGAAQAEPAPSLEDRNTQALCALLAMAREATATRVIFNPPLQSPSQHLGDDKLPALAGPWARVLAHYGIDIGGMWDHPIVPALLTTGPALWALARDLGEELRARKARPLTDAETSSQDPAAGD